MNARIEQERDDGPPRGEAWYELWYLLFVFVPLLFWRGWSTTTLVASIAAVVLFVPIHFAFRREGIPLRTRRLMVAVVAAFGFALVPLNPGGNTFVIYAAAMAGVVFPPRTSIVLAAAMLLVMGVEFFLVLPNLGLAAGYSLMTVIIAALVLVGVLYGRERERRNAELRLTRDEVARLAAMAERERIGRDLHDLLGHTLSVVALKSELAGRLVESDPEAARRQIGEVEQVARQALAQVREAVVGIRATGLQAELAAARLALLSAEVRLDQRLAPVSLAPATESALSLALRESVTNILRHAAASRVDVELAADGYEWRLTIADDGRGGAGREGNGLAGMRERLAAIGGRVEFDSPPGGGTRVQLVFPAAGIEGPAP